MGRVFLAVAWWVTFFATSALSAEIGGPTYSQTSTGVPGGFIARMASCCLDTNLGNAACDSGLNTCWDGAAGHWTKGAACRGASQIAVFLGQGATGAGNTSATVYNCADGWVGATDPATQTQYCQDITTRFAGGALTDTAPDLSPQPWAGAQNIVTKFSCTTRCEPADLWVTCRW